MMRPHAYNDEPFLAGLGVSDLVTQDSNATFGEEVACAVVSLKGHNSSGSIDATHGEEVHDREGAPADDSQALCKANPFLDH